ncbi:MAG: hypothetical protein ABJB02_03670, partial [Dokdonella sp.]
QQQEIALDVAAGTSVLDIEIHPQFAPFTPLFAESAWELRGAWKDAIFASSFEGVLAFPAAR